jgi:hypothetical protein
MKKQKFEFPFYGRRGRGETHLRNALVLLLNQKQDKFDFGTFTTNATNFHSDGCIYAVRRGDKAHNRNNKTVVFCYEYGASLPSCFANDETRFDKAYIAAIQFIKESDNEKFKRDDCRD